MAPDATCAGRPAMYAGRPSELPAGSRRAAIRNRLEAHRARMRATSEAANIGIAATIITFVIGIVIAVKFLPTLTSSIAETQGDGNLSASDSSLLDVVPAILVIVLVIAAMSIFFLQIRKSKLGGT